MAPHIDAPSPSGSYSNWSDRVPSNRRPLASSSLRLGTESQSPLSSSFDSTSLDEDYSMARPLVPGVYVPTVCFFEDGTEDVDTDRIAKHAVRLAQAGVTGLATQGSNGEAVHLTREERNLVTWTTRHALDTAGFKQMPVIVGCGAQSTREATQLCCDAAKNGGDYALVLPPSYYAGLFKPSLATVLEYFTAVADKSPVPLIIYNYPGAVNGMDLSSDIILKLAQHSNIVGVKLTCGNTGKLNRVAAATRKSTKNYSRGSPEFLVLAGSADFTIQSLVAGGHGILAGLANIAPKACLKTIELYEAGKYDEAQEMQDIVSQGDWVAIQSGVIGVKSGLQSYFGYGGVGRSPLPQPTAEQAKAWKDGFQELVLLEKSL